MAGASGATLAATLPFVDEGARLGLFLGMLAPLAAAVVTWVVMERTYRLRPEALTLVMIVGFGLKLMFFGGYVAVVLGWMSLRPIPFVASLTAYFIGLHLTEALYLRRLFAAWPVQTTSAHSI
jgi:CHASE2 domain-containing sensor protein